MPIKLVPFFPAGSVAKMIRAISSHSFRDSLPRDFIRLDKVLNSLTVRH